MRLREIFRAHRCAFVVAFLIGLVFVLPNILFIIEAGEDYHYPFLGMPDERHYASRINEIYDGHYLIANTDLKEYKDSPHFWQPLCEIIVGILGKILGLKIENLLVLSDFLFPFLLFLATYWFAFFLIESKIIALLGTCAIMINSVLIFGPPQSLIYWIDRLPWLDVPLMLNPKSSFLFSRSINPQFNLILFFLCLSGVYGTITRESKGYPLLGGIIIGSFFYCNFYYWSYVICGTGLYCGYCLLRKDFKTFWKLITMVMLGSLLAIPYLLSVRELSSAPFYEEVIRRGYMYFTHKPYLQAIELLPIFVFLVFCPGKNRPYFFMASLFLGGIICENQQILTGNRLTPYHWSIYCQAPLMWLGVALMANNIGQQWANNRLIRFIKLREKAFAFILLLFLFLNALHTQIVYVYATDREAGPRAFFEKSLPTWLYYQKLEPALSRLNEEAEKEAVVLASVWSSYLITAFTHCNIVVGWHTQLYLLSNEELWERWLLKSYFFGVPDDKVFEVHEPNLDGICLFCQKNWAEEDRPDSRERIESRYRKVKQTPLQDLLAKYDVEYVFYSLEEREEYRIEETGFDISQYDFLELLVKTEDFELYRIRRLNK